MGRVLACASALVLVLTVLPAHAFSGPRRDTGGGPPATPAARVLDEAAAGRFARLALACVHREYPSKIAHVLSTDADVRPPRDMTPAFYGCYDWHLRPRPDH